VVDLLFERMLRKVGAEELKEVLDAGAVKGGDRAAVGSAEYGGVVERWVCVDGEITGRESTK
jgi:hypothetical protein